MSAPSRRVLAAFPPVGEVLWSGMGPVGILRYRDAGVPRMAVAVRVVSPFPAAGEPFLPGEPLPPSETLPGAPQPLLGRELVPFKHACDVGVVGTLVSAGASVEAPGVVPLEVRVGDERRRLSLPLGGSRVELGELLGPRAIDPLPEYAGIDLAEGTEAFQSAGAPLRFRRPEAGTTIAIASSFFSLEAALGFTVFLRIDYLDGAVSLPDTRCDSITFDLDRRQVEWVFRGLAHDPAEGRDIERVVVAALAPHKDEERAAVDAWLPHAAWRAVSGPEHARAAVHPLPPDDEELAMARYSTWDLGPVAPTLPIEEVAGIQVELSRTRDRAAVLAAYGLTPYAWSVEERAAMERLAEAGLATLDAAGEEDPAPGKDLARYQEARARAAAETPFEGRPWTIPEYAALRAALETRNPIRVLEQAGLGPAELIGLDQQMEARFEASPEERCAFEERFEEAFAAGADGEDGFDLETDDEGEDDEDDR